MPTYSYKTQTKQIWCMSQDVLPVCWMTKCTLTITIYKKFFLLLYLIYMTNYVYWQDILQAQWNIYFLHRCCGVKRLLDFDKLYSLGSELSPINIGPSGSWNSHSIFSVSSVWKCLICSPPVLGWCLWLVSLSPDRTGLVFVGNWLTDAQHQCSRLPSLSKTEWIHVKNQFHLFPPYQLSVWFIWLSYLCCRITTIVNPSKYICITVHVL